MRATFLLLLVFCFATLGEPRSVEREKRQTQRPPRPLPPVATGEILTSAFQIPIQTLSAVHDLLQATRGRINALQQRYQVQQQRHPNHKPNPHFVRPQRTSSSRQDRRRHDSQEQYYNSKALYQ